jgi:hypothetical protein
MWMVGLTGVERTSLKFYDETRVDRSNVGDIYIWSRGANSPRIDHYKANIKESYTVTPLTTLDDEPSVIFFQL